MSPLISEFPADDPVADSLLDMVRPDALSSRVAVVADQLVLRLWTETWPEQLFASRQRRGQYTNEGASSASGHNYLRCLGSDTVDDLARGHAILMGEALPREDPVKVPTWTIRTTQRARARVGPGAGMHFADLRDDPNATLSSLAGPEPCSELVDLLADPSIVGALLRHPELDESCWIVILKSEAIRPLEAHDLVRIQAEAPERPRDHVFGPPSWLERLKWLNEHLRELITTVLLLARLTAAVGLVTAAATITLHALGII